MLSYEFDPLQASSAKARMEQRTSPEVKSLIERAAHALGISPSEFVTSAACREARATLAQCEVTRVPAEAARAFVAAFESDQPTTDLVDLMRLHGAVTAAKAEAAR